MRSSRSWCETAPREPIPELVLCYVPATIVIFLVGGPVEEEPAWRGFALPRLQEPLGPTGRDPGLGCALGLLALPALRSRPRVQRIRQRTGWRRHSVPGVRCWHDGPGPRHDLGIQQDPRKRAANGAASWLTQRSYGYGVTDPCGLRQSLRSVCVPGSEPRCVDTRSSRPRARGCSGELTLWATVSKTSMELPRHGISGSASGRPGSSRACCDVIDGAAGSPWPSNDEYWGWRLGWRQRRTSPEHALRAVMVGVVEFVWLLPLRSGLTRCERRSNRGLPLLCRRR